MKLQSRKTLHSQSIAEKQIQIDEGVKIAKKIDVMRETLSSLEVQHEKLTVLLTEESNLLKKKLDLEVATKRSEIASLEEKRRALLKPLEEEEKAIKLKREELTSDLEQIEITRQIQETNQLEIVLKRKEIDKKLSAIKNKEERTERNLTESENLRLEAIEIRNMAEVSAESKIAIADAKLKEVSIKEKENLFNEEANKNYKIYLENKEEELNRREEFINDKYKTFQRTVERYGKRI